MQDWSLSSYRCVAGENMNLPVSLAVLALSVALLFFGRGREGEAHPIIRKSPWIVGQLFGMTVMVMFAVDGHRGKSELAALTARRFLPP